MRSGPDARRLRELAGAFLRLGCLSFGGPAAHLGYVRAEVVERRRWLDDARYAELVALCQFLPGPASSQLVFAIGLERAGLAGAAVASCCFTLPSALLMFAFALGVAELPALARSGALHGLRIAAVAVVAQAAWALGRASCPDRARVALALAAAAAITWASSPVAQLGALVFGAMFGLVALRGAAPPASAAPPAGAAVLRSPVVARSAVVALLAFVALLAVLPALASATGARALEVVDAFYRAGALVFGGGHVVLPLLRAELVPRGWVSDDTFLAGYAAAQAVPGPLFTLSAYLGAMIDVGLPQATGAAVGAAVGAALALVALFLPGWLVVFGALPHWRRLREHRVARAALAGANAAVVGVLLAAAYDPVFTEAVHAPLDAALVLVAFAALHGARWSPGLVVLGAAGVGHLLLGG